MAAAAIQPAVPPPTITRFFIAVILLASLVAVEIIIFYLFLINWHYKKTQPHKRLCFLLKSP
jgi:hypothetical protein